MSEIYHIFKYIFIQFYVVILSCILLTTDGHTFSFFVFFAFTYEPASLPETNKVSS